LLFQHSMDAGDRWMLNDAAGKPMLAWDSRGHTFRTDYDALHRPVGSFVKGTDPLAPERIIQFEKVIYGDTPNNGLTDDLKTQLNLRGKPYQQYDTAGLVISMGRNPFTEADEAYDFKGNLLRSTRQLVGDYKNTPDWSQNPALEPEIFATSTTYDALNRPVRLVSPHTATMRPNIIQPSYNEANLLEKVNVWLHQTTVPEQLLDPSTADLPAVKNINYNAKGQRLLIEYGNSVKTQYDYDEQTFRLTRLYTIRTGEYPSSPLLLVNSKTLQDLHYTYDPVGNITNIRDDALPVIVYNGEQVKPIWQYTYDALYRLTQAEGREHAGQTDHQPTAPRDNYRDYPFQNLPNANDLQALRNYTELYDYDSVGNILAMMHQFKDGSWTRYYDYETDNNRLRSTSLPGDPVDSQHLELLPTRYTYNAHGSMTQMPHLPEMQWDFKDQLQQVRLTRVNPETNPNEVGVDRAYYVYDATGQRVRKVIEHKGSNGQVTENKERIYLGDFELYRERNGSGATLERETLHIMDDQQRIALVETKTFDIETPNASITPAIRYQLSNHLGSASVEVDEAGALISREEYHPYGTTSYQVGRSGAEVSLKRYRYTGKERDEETGLSYHGARYYAPWLGRWTSTDPIGIKDGVNVYMYVRGNPCALNDPSGSQGKSPKDMTLDEYRAVNSRRKSYQLKDEDIVRQYYIDHPSKGRRRGTSSSLSGAKGSTGSGVTGSSTTPPSDRSSTSPTSSSTSSSNTAKDKSTEMDYATALIGKILDPRFWVSATDEKGVSGGIPGGKGSASMASSIGQAIYIGINLAFTFAGSAIESGLRKGVSAVRSAVSAAWNKVRATVLQIATAPVSLFLGAGGTGGGLFPKRMFQPRAASPQTQWAATRVETIAKASGFKVAHRGATDAEKMASEAYWKVFRETGGDPSKAGQAFHDALGLPSRGADQVLATGVNEVKTKHPWLLVESIDIGKAMRQAESYLKQGGTATVTYFEIGSGNVYVFSK
jgi:RHS repeat-associated protein